MSIIGGGTASRMMGEGEIIPGFTNVMRDNFWHPDVVAGNALTTFIHPILLIFAFAT